MLFRNIKLRSYPFLLLKENVCVPVRNRKRRPLVGVV